MAMICEICGNYSGDQMICEVCLRKAKEKEDKYWREKQQKQKDSEDVKK